MNTLTTFGSLCLLSGQLLITGALQANVTELNFETLNSEFSVNSLEANGSAVNVSVSGAASGNNYLYTVTYTGSDFDGDSVNDTLTVDILVEGIEGSVFDGGVGLGDTAGNSTTDASVTSLGIDAAVGILNSADGQWAVGEGMRNGDTLKFSVVSASSSVGVVQFNGFGALFADEFGSHSHQAVIGLGTELQGYDFNGNLDISVSPASSELYVTAANNNTGNNRWGIGSVDFDLTVTAVDPLLLSNTVSYDEWRTHFGLAENSEYDDDDNDGYTNFEEYTFGSYPSVFDDDGLERQDAVGLDRFVMTSTGDTTYPLMGEITIRGGAPNDIHYKIMRSNDSEPGNLYEDWLFVNSRWKQKDWVVDFPMEEIVGTNGLNTIRIWIPAEYTNEQFRCFVMDTDVYPEFSWDRVIRRASPSEGMTDEMSEFYALNYPYSVGKIVQIARDANGEVYAEHSDLDKVMSYSAEHKNLSYINSGIVNNNQMYEELNLRSGLGSLPSENWAAWNEYTDLDYLGTRERPYIDWSKPAAITRFKQIIDVYASSGNDGIFMDALGKINGPMDSAYLDNDHRVAHLKGYCSVMEYLKEVHEGGIRMANSRGDSSLVPEPRGFTNEFTDECYESNDGIVNAYFNARHIENWTSYSAETMANNLDRIIHKWTKHSMMLQLSVEDVLPPTSYGDLLHVSGMLLVMGENTFVGIGAEGETGGSSRGSGDPGYWTYLGNKNLGEPVSIANRSGYVYTREFDYASVMLDLENNKARIEWRNTDQTIYEIWETVSNIADGSLAIGKDDFDGDEIYLSRSFSGVINDSDYTFDIINRTTVVAEDLIDTTAYLADGSSGDHSDQAGFLQSTKTDNLLGIHEVSSNTITYTFDVSGYEDLSLGMSWAAFGNPVGTEITVSASIDGSPAETVFNIDSIATNPIYIMEDGTELESGRCAMAYQNGIRLGMLLNEFQPVDAAIAGTGSTLTLVISAAVGDLASFGMDELKIYGLYGTVNGVSSSWLASYGLELTEVATLADTDGDGLTNLEEYLADKNPLVNDSSPGFQVTEYYLTTGDFVGTDLTVTLDESLQGSDFFILVRGSHAGDSLSMPDNDYVRVTAVPGAVGDMAGSGNWKRIVLSRAKADLDWEGVVTVVECTNPLSAKGFKLVDILSTDLSGTTGVDTSASWTDVNQVVLFGGYRGGGANFVGTPTSRLQGSSVYTRLYPSGTDTLNWTRDAAGETLVDAVMTTFVVEWGSAWRVQHVNVAGSNGGNGADAIGEYTTASIDTVKRASSWVWGTGTRVDSGVGDNAEACLVTLGDGVNSNSKESTVAVGSEYTDTYDFDLYVMTCGEGLSVDHRFVADGNANVLDLPVTMDAANPGARFGWSYNGCNGTGDYLPRPRMWARYTGDSEITISRGFDGQDFPAWVQGVDFSELND